MENIIQMDRKSIIFILAPIIREKKGIYEKVLKDLKDEGYSKDTNR